MILGLLLSITALAVVSSVFGDDLTESENLMNEGGDDLLIGQTSADGLSGDDHAE